jgi:hypothetical protein
MPQLAVCAVQMPFILQAAKRRGAQGACEMAEEKRLFRRVLEAIVQGRNRQARRYIADYVREHGLDRPAKD